MDTSMESIGLDEATVGIIVIVFFCIYGFRLAIGAPSSTTVIIALLRGRKTLWQILGMFVGIVQVITQKAILYLILLMALNRLSLFCLPRINRMFTEKNTKWSLLLTWIVILGMSTVTMILSPAKKFNKEIL
ncbi:hypothetical protein PENTCL1PPCAC_17672, partial [Pristionchus entomophagus]